jgi:tRNA (guanine-N7-)-methyltransferase
MTAETRSHRPIRSFVRRESRMTASQREALRELWPRYGLTLGDTPIELDTLFKRTAPRCLEIGFGNGEALTAMAAANPQNDYIGVEVHRPGVGQALRDCAARDVGNVRVCCVDVNDVLARLPDEAFTSVYLFFPDPWPKKRHHKRRLLQPDFADSVRRKLTRGGLFCLATDWEDYAVHMLAVLTQAPGFENTAGDARYVPRPVERPLTKFERRGQRLGHTVYDLAFRRVS